MYGFGMLGWILEPVLGLNHFFVSNYSHPDTVMDAGFAFGGARVFYFGFLGFRRGEGPRIKRIRHGLHGFLSISSKIRAIRV